MSFLGQSDLCHLTVYVKRLHLFYIHKKSETIIHLLLS